MGLAVAARDFGFVGREPRWRMQGSCHKSAISSKGNDAGRRGGAGDGSGTGARGRGKNGGDDGVINVECKN